jgi:hypothetical protein
MIVKLLSATLLMSKAGIFGDVASDMAVAFLALERIRLDLTCGSVTPGRVRPSLFSASTLRAGLFAEAKPHIL